MKDELKAILFRDLVTSDLFQAQLALEEEAYQSLLKNMLAINLSQDSNPALEYARLRGSLETLTSLKRNRERLVEIARSREKTSNS